MRFAVYLAAASVLMASQIQANEAEAEIELYEAADQYVDVPDHFAESDAEAESEAESDAESDAESEVDTSNMTEAELEKFHMHNPFKGAGKKMKDGYNHLKNKVVETVEHAKEDGKKALKAIRGASLTSVSSAIRRGLTGMTAFGAMAQDYVDYCAMYGASDKDKPLSFSDYFDNATFWHGGGDWFTYETLHKHMGDDEADITVEKYMKARQTSRTGNLKERNDIIAKKIQELENHFKTNANFHPDMEDPVSIPNSSLTYDLSTIGLWFPQPCCL